MKMAEYVAKAIQFAAEHDHNERVYFRVVDGVLEVLGMNYNTSVLCRFPLEQQTEDVEHFFIMPDGVISLVEDLPTFDKILKVSQIAFTLQSENGKISDLSIFTYKYASDLFELRQKLPRNTDVAKFMTTGEKLKRILEPFEGLIKVEIPKTLDTSDFSGSLMRVSNPHIEVETTPSRRRKG